MNLSSLISDDNGVYKVNNREQLIMDDFSLGYTLTVFSVIVRRSINVINI